MEFLHERLQSLQNHMRRTFSQSKHYFSSADNIPAYYVSTLVKLGFLCIFWEMFDSGGFLDSLIAKVMKMTVVESHK